MHDLTTWAIYFRDRAVECSQAAPECFDKKVEDEYRALAERYLRLADAKDGFFRGPDTSHGGTGRTSADEHKHVVTDDGQRDLVRRRLGLASFDRRCPTLSHAPTGRERAQSRLRPSSF